MKVMKKSTAKTKAKRLNWKHQGKYGTNSKGNDNITANPDINTMSSQRRIRKETTTDTAT